MVDEITPKEEIAVEAPIEPVYEPIQAPESQTAQIPVNEPLAVPIETPSEPEAESVAETIPAETKPVETSPEELPPSASLPEEKPLASSDPKPIETKADPEQKETSEIQSEPKQEIKLETKSEPVVKQTQTVIIPDKKSLVRELLVKARSSIQFRKRKKLDRVLSLFAKQTKITNDEVEKFLHVSDATATRYLSQLEKEGKIKQNGKTGKWVSYSKI